MHKNCAKILPLCRAQQTTDCSIQWVHRSRSCAGRLTSALLAARHIQSIQIAIKDVLEHSPEWFIERQDISHGQIVQSQAIEKTINSEKVLRLRQHPSCGDCLEVKREYYQNSSVLDCVTQCSQSAAHLYEQFLQVQLIGFVTLGPLRCA